MKENLITACLLLDLQQRPDLGSLKDITVEVVDETGFDILSHRLVFFGICGDCKRE